MSDPPYLSATMATIASLLISYNRPRVVVQHNGSTQNSNIITQTCTQSLGFTGLLLNLIATPLGEEVYNYLKELAKESRDSEGHKNIADFLRRWRRQLAINIQRNLKQTQEIHL